MSIQTQINMNNNNNISGSAIGISTGNINSNIQNLVNMQSGASGVANFRQTMPPIYWLFLG